jgi:hypothetical protein
VFVAAWEGLIYGLNAATGRELWRLDAGEPISGSPCLADGTLFIGTRRGAMLALGLDGRLKWKQPLSWHIYSTAAWDGGRVFVVTEDMFVHCLDARTGRPIWKSDKLYGMLFREFYPVIHKGKVFVSVTPAEWRSSIPVRPFVWDPGRSVMDRYSAPIMPRAGKVGAPRRSLIRDGKLPSELDRAQQNLVRFYEQNPRYQAFYVLNAANGKQPYKPVHVYGSAGLQNVIMAPAACADGTLVMYCFMGGARLARFDPDANRWVDFLFEIGGTNNDESEYDSVGGSRIFSKNTMRANAVMGLATREVTRLARPNVAPVRVSCLPPRWSPAGGLSAGRLGWGGWHGELVGMSPMPISGKRFFWMRQVQRLVAYEGR